MNGDTKKTRSRAASQAPALIVRLERGSPVCTVAADYAAEQAARPLAAAVFALVARHLARRAA